MLTCEKYEMKVMAVAVRVVSDANNGGRITTTTISSSNDEKERKDSRFSRFLSVALYQTWEETGLHQAFINHHRTEQFRYTARSKPIHLYRRTAKEVNLNRRYILEITIELC